MRTLAVFLLAAALCVPALAQGPRTVIRSDFLVNDDTLTYGSYHYPVSAADRDGNFVAVWYEDCNGDHDIYARRFDAAGTPLGPSFRVNDDAAAYEQQSPCVAVAGSGKFVVVWTDPRDGLTNIYAQRYGADGAALGPNILVCEEDGYSSQKAPRVAMNDQGAFTVVWRDDRDGCWRIYAHRFDSAGVSLGGDYRVDDNPEFEDQYAAAVAMDGAGGFVVAWGDYRAGNTNVYARRFGSSGAPLDTGFMVNTDVLMSQFDPEIGMNGAGAFVIAWTDLRHITHYDVYAQRYSSSGAAQGGNFLVNDDGGEEDQFEAAVTVDSSGNFVIAWRDDRTSARGTYFQRYSSSGSAQGPNVKVTSHNFFEHSASVAMAWSGGFHILNDQVPMGANGYRVKAQRYDAFGAAQGPAFQVNDNAAHSDQTLPSVGMDRAGNFTVAWQDQTDISGPYDFFLQRCDPSGNKVGQNTVIYDYISGTSFLPYPVLAVSAGGNSAAALVEPYRGYVLARRFDAGGAPVGGHFPVGDTTTGARQSYPSIAMDGIGKMAVAWEDQRGDTFDIYLQRADSSGALLGGNVRVNGDAAGFEQRYAAAAMSHAGDLLVVWRDMRDGNANIYGQRYDPSGAAVGGNFRVNDDAGTRTQTMPAVACDSAGNAVVVWEDARGSISYHDIYAQRYDAAGAAVGANFRVEDDPGLSFQANPSVACAPSGERFVVCWTDYRNPDGDPEIMAQSYLSGSPVGGNFLAIDQDSFPYHHQTTNRCNVSANDGLVAFAWTDNRRHKGYDVYARLMDWNFLSGLTGGPGPAAGTQRLRAYPNPFKGSVAIDAPVKLFAVYDVSGRLIGTVEGNSWDGRDGTGRKVASGVYVLKAKGYLPVKVTVLR